MLKDIKAVIFDLDGSLIDSMWIWHQIDIEYLARFGQMPPPEGLQGAINGMSFSETAAWFKEHYQIPDSIEKIKSDWNQMAWDKYEHSCMLKKGAKEFLELCRSRNILLAIATSNSRELAEHVIKSRGLNGYFTCILTSCDVGKGKPAPDIYLAAASVLDIPPDNCLVFEDIVPGIQSGKTAGMRVCAVYDEASADQEQEKRKLADYYIQDYSEISNITEMLI